MKKRLDYEEIQQVEFTLKAYDSGVPQLSAAAVIRVNVVNINDMNPVFNAVRENHILKLIKVYS